ncbi:MAG: VC0807 family protein [Mycobacterium sp.]
MPEQPSADTDTPRSLGEYIKTTAVNTLPPVAAYYALRAFDVVPYLALVGAIVTAAVQGLLTMARRRKVEPANILVLVGSACSLTIALTTKNPRVVQALELVPMSLLVWSFAISGLVRKPNSKKVAAVISPALAESVLPQRGWTDHDIADWHTLHTRLCLWLGLLCGIYPAFALYLIFHFPVDVSQILIVATGPTLVVLCIVAAVTLIRKFVQRRDPVAAPTGHA